MLFGAIIGDIAGSVYEFANIRSKNFPFMTDRCYITDDSCMSIAVASAIKQWRIANQVTLQRIGQCVADGGPVAYMDLIAAIDAGVDINILKYLISKCDNINGGDENGQTALHHCVQNYVSLDLVNELFIAGINSAICDIHGKDARDYLDEDFWGDDYGTARMMLRPSWTYFYDE